MRFGHIILKKLGLGLAGIIFVGIAFILGVQENFYFAALSFLSFFLLGVVCFMQIRESHNNDKKNNIKKA